MNDLTKFPAFLTMEYDENGAFQRFKADVDSSNTHAERKFKATSDAIDKQLTAALTRPRSASGAIDLGVPELRAAADAADERARAAREVAIATTAAARAEGDYSAQARQASAAADALANDERQAAIAARGQAAAAEQVQAQLDRQAAATTRLSVSTRNSTLDIRTSSRAAAAGYQQLGFQIQDVVAQASTGTAAMTIFAQQGGQVAQALALMGQSADGTASRFGKFATFLSGPWGAAIIGATTVAGFLISSFYEADEAAKAATIGADALGSAQSVLGGIFDETSGRINAQNELLIANARLTAINLRADAVTKRTAFATTLASSGDQNSRSVLTGLGVQGAADAPSTLALRKQQIEVNNLLRQVRGGTVSAGRGLQIAEGLDISKLALSRTQLLQSIIDITTADASEQAAGLIDKSLDSGKLASQFRKAEPTKKPTRERKGADTTKAAAREAERLDTAADRAAEAIARINSAFDDQPTLVDKSAKAVRDLDAVIAELAKPKNAGLDPAERIRLTAAAEAAKLQASSAVGTELDKTILANETNLNLLSLQARGLGEQAEVLRRINAEDERLGLTAALRQLEDQRIEAESILSAETSTNDERDAARAKLADIGTQTGDIVDQQERLRGSTEQTVEAERRYGVEAERTNRIIGARLDTVQTAYAGIEDILSGQGTAGDLLANVKASFDRLRGAQLADALFGDAFEVLAEKARKQTPLGQATDKLRGEVDRSTGALDQLATAVEGVTTRLTNAAAIPGITAPAGDAANDNSGPIVVQGSPTRIESASIKEMADALGISIAAPLASNLNEFFGTSFFSHLQNTLGGAVSGYAQGGTVGGILGGLQGGVADLFDAGRISKKLAGDLDEALGGALGGAAKGSQISGLANALGLKLNGTGASIGGAIGSFVPIPGGEIIGSILGGLVGNLFGKSKVGSANLSGPDSFSLSGNNSDRRDTASSLGGTVLDALKDIATRLDGTVGKFATSIGVSGDSFHVDVTGQGRLKKSQGGYDFDDDQAAAVAFAISDAITDGAIQGIRATTQRILKAGKDLESALTDALDFESVFKRLKGYRDPLGAAMDELDSEFSRLDDLFKSAGASAAEYADLEELYGIERAKVIKEQADRITGTLQSFLNDLTINNDARSLRDREGAARAAYDPLAARVAAGDQSAYDDYANAAKELLDIQRQYSGSQSGYFDLLDQVTGLTRSRIASERDVISISEGRDSPFAAPGGAKDNQSVVSAIDRLQAGLLSGLGGKFDQLDNRLSAINQNLGRSLSGGSSTSARFTIERQIANF